MAFSPGHTPQDIQNHLYRAFLNRATTDISVNIYAQGWQVAYDLHRVVLIQSGFFRSLFTRGFKEQARRSTSPSSDSGDTIDVHFDDPNITRAAFEICIAWLYGGGPALHVSASLMPTTSQPLTPFNLGSPPYQAPPTGQQPATPRFLLSITATSIYLSIPQVTSQALGLVLATIGPSTLTRYLRFSLGNGIGDAGQGDLASAVGLEHVGRDLVAPLELVTEEEGTASAAASLPDTDGSHDAPDDVASRKHGVSGSGEIGNNKDEDDAASAAGDDTAGLTFHYGIVSDKIGEACACWLARWAVDIFPFEEDWNYAQQAKTGGGGNSRLLALRDGGHNRSPSHPPRASTSAPNTPSQLSVMTSGRRATISSSSPSASLDGRSGLGHHLLPPGAKPPAIWSRKGGMTARWVRGLLSSDDLFIRGGEKDRYDFAVRVVEMRRREVRAMYTVEEGVVDDRKAVAFEIDEEEKEWEELFRTGFYYSHMSLEDLLRIQKDVSPTTKKPYVSLPTLKTAHWNQSLFRSNLMAKPSVNSPSARSGSPRQSTSESPPPTKGSEPWKDSVGSTVTQAAIVSSISSGSSATSFFSEDVKTYFPVLPDGSQKFGGDISRDTIDALALDAAGGDHVDRKDKKAGVVRGRRLTEENFFGLTVNGRRTAEEIVSDGCGQDSDRWTETEPCRFSVEFWNVEALKQSNRLYSHTVWCMGSLWNVYVQIVRKKGLQLGVYLQRQSFVDPVPAHSVPPTPSVSVSFQQSPSLHASSSVPSFVDRPTSPATGSMQATPTPSRSRPWAIPGHSQSTTGFPLFRSTTPVGSPQANNAGALPGTPPPATTSLSSSTTTTLPATAPASVPHSPYRDPRQSIAAYFSIHCPSATGSSATKFSSEPDTFNVTQSWGWKSSKAEEWVDFDDTEGGARERGGGGMGKLECSLRATIVLGVV